MKHKTKNIVIKQEDVDKKIIPVVDWLNSFNGICTLYCCEGYSKKEIDKNGRLSFRSYVLFSSSDNWSLMQVMQKFNKFADIWPARVELNFHPEYNYPIRYHMVFEDKSVLKKFIKWIKSDFKKFPLRKWKEEMSLSDCEKCYDTPCTCGHEYKNWSVRALENQIKMLQGVLKEKQSGDQKDGQKTQT